jgi:hypothetical protein
LDEWIAIEIVMGWMDKIGETYNNDDTFIDISRGEMLSPNVNE